MTFLTPGLALLAAGIGVPALILLHVLRLRRLPQRVPSTLLWRRSVQDLEANVPFQRLRFSWLFVLQMAALLCAALAAGQPVWRTGEAASSLVIVLDARARMRATVEAPRRDGAGDTATGRAAPVTRFDRAVERARSIVRSRAGRETTVHLVTARATPALVASGSPGAILDALDRTAVTDEPGDAADAMALAAQVAPDGEIQWIGDDAGQAEHNVGITTLSAQRSAREPGTVDVLVGAVNSGDAPVEVPLVVSLDGETMAARAIRLPAAEVRPGEPGRASVLVRVPERPGAVLAAQIVSDDALPLDDVAGLRFSPPVPVRIALMSPADDDGARSPLAALLQVMEGVRVEPRPCDARRAALEGIDLVVADGCTPGGIDGGDGGAGEAGAAARGASRGDLPPWIVFAWEGGGASAGSGASQVFRAVVPGAARSHPVMQGVPSVAIDVSAPIGARVDGELPRGAVPLLVDRDAVLAYVDPSGPGIRFRFPLSATDWSVQPSWVMAMQNAVQWLVGEESDSAGEAIRTGAPARVLVERRDGSRAWVRLAPPERTGSIEVRSPDGAVIAHPVSLLDEAQSDLRRAPPPPDPRGFEQRAAARSAAAAEADDGHGEGRGRLEIDRRERPLWPFLAAAALALLVIEWSVYLAALHRGAVRADALPDSLRSARKR